MGRSGLINCLHAAKSTGIILRSELGSGWGSRGLPITVPEFRSETESLRSMMKSTRPPNCLR